MLDSATTTPSASELEAHRAALTGHCYRMLGSAAEADDAVQETMIRALRHLGGFEGRAKLRTWLTTIATRVCLDALADRSRRARPIELQPCGTTEDALTTRPSSQWVEPIPDAHAVPSDCDPAERAALKQSIRLAFVAALQHLPPKQRAALLLTEVLGWAATEVAESLETSVASINSALQRARATLATRNIDDVRAPLPVASAQLVDRYLEAFERYDMDAFSQLLRDDAVLSMPPFSLWLQGPASIRTWMTGRGGGCKGSKLLRVEASGLPAFAQYRPAAPDAPSGVAYQAFALIVLETAGDRIRAITSFLDVGALFPRFGMPLELF